jgi:hypothetical protein
MRSAVLREISLFIVCVSAACGPGPSMEAATLALETEDPRFEILLESSLPASAAVTRELRLRLVSKTGWHMTPEAPTILDLAAPPGIELVAPLQRGEDAVSSSGASIEFAVAYRVVSERAASDANAHVEGRVKFGVCRNESPRCEIVHRELQIPLAPF